MPLIRKCARLLLWHLPLLIILLQSPAPAFEYRFGGAVFEGIFSEHNYWDPFEKEFNREELYRITDVYADIWAATGENLSAYAAVGADWEQTWEPDTASDIDVEMRNLYATYSRPRFSTHLGLQWFEIGRGLIFSDNEPGIEAQWEPYSTAWVGLAAVRAVDNSPLVRAEVGYRPGYLESVSLFGAWMRDEDDGFAGTVAPYAPALPLESSGSLYWGGGQWDIFLGEFFLSGIAMMQSGYVKLYPPNGGNLKMDVQAFLIDTSLHYWLTETVSAEAFLFAASGDSHPLKGDIHAFIAPRPYNPRAAIFFNGGLDAQDILAGFSLGGVRWPGVVAPGATLNWNPWQSVTTKLTGMLFATENRAEGGRDLYGWEADLSVSYSRWEILELFAELGIFRHGDVFENGGRSRPDNAYRAAAGFQVTF